MTGARSDTASRAAAQTADKGATVAGMPVRASCDLAQGRIDVSVGIAASPERVFRALTSDEICAWWMRPGVFDTRQWSGDLRVGGRWQASGIGNGRPYGLEGEFREIDPPRKLVHTWQMIGVPMPPSVATFRLDAVEGGTRLRLEHAGFVVPEACANTCSGWETSFEQLAELLAVETR